ncbi:hypothetical protein, partial [Pseudonocardia sulfidoxydans]
AGGPTQARRRRGGRVTAAISYAAVDLAVGGFSRPDTAAEWPAGREHRAERRRRRRRRPA